jgi:hypothetical protein
MTDDVFIKHLGSSIQSWLNYITAVGRKFVLSESSIKLPLAEFIGTKIADTDAVKLEYLHPNFFKKRLDLYFKQKRNLVETQTAFEFKYIKDASTLDKSEKQRIFDDLLRLLFFINNSTNPTKGYFLICGTQYEFDRAFQKILPSILPSATGRRRRIKIPKQSGFYTKWFSFNYRRPRCVIDILNGQNDYKSIYSKSFKEYGKAYKKKTNKRIKKPNSLTTRLVFLSQENEQKDIPESMKIGVWEILN